ncbi:MAG TPA: type IV pilus modification protein PilV [Gammaproteobacteria bacterium]|nr:type IV pilus modification protein PilV [Gammaproteobacteria bacterium]
MTTANHRYRQSGVSLLEVMITTVIITVALLGLAGLQTTSINFNQSAYHRSQASFLISDIMDRIRANTGVNANLYVNTIPVQTAACLTPDGCTPIQMVGHDLFEWQQAITTALPNGGAGAIAANQNTIQITINWTDGRQQQNPRLAVDFIP